jgi:hypothetical protein
MKIIEKISLLLVASLLALNLQAAEQGDDEQAGRAG